MAEAVIGLAASSLGLATFACTLIKSVIKIRSFCADVKDAPEELQDLLDRLENLANFLQDLGQQQAEGPNVPRDALQVQKCVVLFERALKCINDTASQLQKELGRKKHLTAFKIVLKKEVLGTLLSKLDRSERDLELAHSIYARAETQRQFDGLLKIVEEVRSGQVEVFDNTNQIVTHLQTSPTASISDRRQRRLHQQRRCGSTTIEPVSQIRLQLPSWLCTYAWNVAVRRAVSGWTIAFKSYRIIESRHPAFEMCEYGRLDEFKESLFRGAITIHDQMVNGVTFFWVSTLY